MQHICDKKHLLKTISYSDSWKDGFTLIEVIIILVVFAFAASMAISFFGDTLLNTSTPFVMLQEQFTDDSADPGVLESIEQIIADYNNVTNKSLFLSSVSGSANYDSVLSASDFSIPAISNTGTSLSFTKVVVRKNDQRILAFFPIF